MRGPNFLLTLKLWRSKCWF